MLNKLTALGSLLISLLIVGLCTETTKELSVNADGGLRMREAPTLDSKNLALIPNLATVDFIEQGNEEVEMAGKRGHWTKIRFLDQTGWVFGAYLSDIVSKDRTVDVQEVLRNAEGFTLNYASNDRISGGNCVASLQLQANGRVTGGLSCGTECDFQFLNGRWALNAQKLQITGTATTYPNCPGFIEEQVSYHFDSFRRDKISLANYSMKSFETNPTGEPKGEK